MSNAKHQDFIDIMKAAGMLLILFGHVIGDPANIYNQVTQPVHTKQIGVAFFVFITGWGLANNTRPALRAVFNRVFPFYFYGIICAVFLSVMLYITKGNAVESNYLPFFFGINVLFNFFPANPTTWYIGTYLHILLFWYFFMQGKEVTTRHLVIAFIAENTVRTLLMFWQQNFIAYMLLPNWLTVFLLGMYLHNRRQLTTSPVALALILAWSLLFAVQTYAANMVGFDHTFPFRKMLVDFSYSLPVESLLISATYIIHTLLFFEIARRLPSNGLIALIARATLITVIIHMPIIYPTHKAFYSLFESEMTARIIYIFMLYFGIALFAEAINRLVDMKRISDRAWDIAARWLTRLGLAR